MSQRKILENKKETLDVSIQKEYFCRPESENFKEDQLSAWNEQWQRRKIW